MYARLKVGLLVACVAIITFISLNLSRYPDINKLWLLVSVAQLAGVLICTAIIFSPVGHKHQNIQFLAISCSITLPPIFLYLIFEGATKFDTVTWTLVFLGQATLLPFKWYLHLLSQSIVMICLLITRAFFTVKPDPYISYEDITFGLYYLLWFCLICDMTVYIHERLQYSEIDAKRKLKVEQKKSEKLLLNILPEPIAKRLHSHERVIADNFDSVTVLFTDIVGFTELSNKLPPEIIVDILNDLFSSLDAVAKRHGVEKIKTIGDSYMVVGGLPTPERNHVQMIADFALEVQPIIDNYNAKNGQHLKVRIGIHTGPVVAGVIGVQKFSYDLWGDTVNTASHMESNGIAGEIQVSEDVYNELKDHYYLVKRGEVQIKGKGIMNTYLLKGRNK